MLSLELSQEQAEVLQEYVEAALRDLSVEIARTDDWDYRQAVKARRALLREVSEKLDPADAPARGAPDGG